MAIALLSVIILITFKLLNNFTLFITLIINIISLWLMIFYIQSIGWNIYSFSLLFIFINNILLSLIRFIIRNLSLNSFIEENLINFWLIYTKIIFTYPIYILRKVLSITGKLLDIINNRINNVIHDLSVIKPLNLLNKEFNVKSKYTLFTFENNYLLDHKNLFATLFAGLMVQSEFKKIGKKFMIVSIFNEDKTFFIHKNIIIDENTTIFHYLEKIKYSIQTFYDSGYSLSTFPVLQIKLWNYESKLTLKGEKVQQVNTFHQFRRDFHNTCIRLKTDTI